MKRAIRCSFLVVTTLWLTGCGLKGPLYWPPAEPTSTQELVAEPETTTYVEQPLDD